MKNVFIIVVLVFFGCKKSKNIKIQTKTAQVENIGFTNKIENKQENDTQASVSDLQGIWQGETDLNQSLSYRVIEGNKILDLTCIEGDCSNESLFFQKGVLGFTNMQSLTKINNQNLGAYFAYESYDSDLKKTVLLLDKSFKLDKGLKVFETSLVSAYMRDEEDPKRLFMFSKIKSLPLELFIAVKGKFKENRFNIFKASSKVTINVDKCYFYEDESLEVKKRAFLIKGDQAYLQQINDKSVKVYFDGKVITSGYLNKSEVTLPN